MSLPSAGPSGVLWWGSGADGDTHCRGVPQPEDTLTLATLNPVSPLTVATAPGATQRTPVWGWTHPRVPLGPTWGGVPRGRCDQDQSRPARMAVGGLLTAARAPSECQLLSQELVTVCPKPGGGLGSCPLAGMGGAGVVPWEPRDSAGAAPSSVLRVLRARRGQDSTAAEEAKQEASPGPRRGRSSRKGPVRRNENPSDP